MLVYFLRSLYYSISFRVVLNTLKDQRTIDIYKEREKVEVCEECLAMNVVCKFTLYLQITILDIRY